MSLQGKLGKILVIVKKLKSGTGVINDIDIIISIIIVLIFKLLNDINDVQGIKNRDIFHIILLISVVLIYFYNKLFLHSKYRNIYFIYLLVAILSFLIHLMESFINKNFFVFQYGANMLHEVTRGLVVTSLIFILDVIINYIGNHLYGELSLRKGFLYGVCVFIQIFIILFFLYSLYGFIATNIFHKFTFDFFMNSENLVY